MKGPSFGFSVLIFTGTAITTSAEGNNCVDKTSGDSVKVSELKTDDFLLEANPEGKIVERLDRMDTANCFEFTLRNGNRVVGKLTTNGGYGLSKFGYESGNDLGPLSIDKVDRIVEYKLDPVKMQARENRELADTGFHVMTLFALGAVFVVALALGGAGMAGGK